MVYDVILLSGDKSSSNNLYNQNKAFLKINDTPIIIYILLALEEAAGTGNIYIVGPKKRLTETVERYVPHLKDNKTVKILEQKQTIFENFWYGYNNMFSDFDDCTILEEYSKKNPEYQKKAVLVMPSDIPLITACEIDYFLSHSDMKSYDYCAGVTSEEHFRFLNPSPENPGIEMAYTYLKEGIYRCNNLHIIKPVMIKNAEYIQRFYDARYQKEARNIIRFISEVVKTKIGYKALFYYIVLQTSLFSAAIGVPGVGMFLRRFVPSGEIEEFISNMLDTHFKMVPVPYAGAAADIDNEKNFEVFSLMFNKWKQYICEK